MIFCRLDFVTREVEHISMQASETISDVYNLAAKLALPVLCVCLMTHHLRYPAGGCGVSCFGLEKVEPVLCLNHVSASYLLIRQQRSVYLSA